MDMNRTLNERRKATTKSEIASAAAELFALRSPSQVTVAEICRRAMVSERTFYRYFSTKEDSIAPLLTSGASRWQALVATPRTNMGIRESLERAIGATLDPADEGEEEELEQTRALLRVVLDDPALADVWYRVNGVSEVRLREVLHSKVVPTGDMVTVYMVAAAATDAVRIALELWCRSDGPVRGPGGPADLAVKCLAGLADGRLLT